jgi:hypothetical protein
MRQGVAAGGYVGVADLVGASDETVRRATDPSYADKRRSQIREARHRRTLLGPEFYRPQTQKNTYEQAVGISPDAMSMKGLGLRSGPQPSRDEALYDPERDGPPRYADETKHQFGDPPIGRRELLEASARRNHRDDSLWRRNTKPWSF